MSDQWKARVTAARRHGYICAGCERYLLLMLDSWRKKRATTRVATGADL
jgi:hypothetical protein